MLESKIAAAPLTLETRAGFPPELDRLAETSLSGHHFLRAAWFRAGASGNSRTLLVRRTGGALVAAIPTSSFGPAPRVTQVLGVRKVPGSYWPLRGILVAPDTDRYELAQALGHRGARRLGAVWRLGPARRDDPATLMVVEAARLAGWQVLSRPAGTSWLIDLDTLRAEGWPKSSTARRLRVAWRKLEERGTPRWRRVRGSDWNDAVIGDMGRIEAQSWIARSTDGSGAKFMRPHQQQLWREALRPGDRDQPVRHDPDAR